MEKQWPSLNWTSDETNLFCEIFADPVKYFMETLERGALKRHSARKYLIPLLLNLKKMFSFKEKKSKNFKAKKKKETKLVAEVEAFTQKAL